MTPMSTLRPDDLVLKIVRDLEANHEFVMRVEARPLQNVVDVKWAIKTAAQILGRPVEAFERRTGSHVVLVASLS